MDGWGALTMLIKRQHADKNRKAQLRYELKKKKEGFLKNKSASEFDFPELTKDEMDRIKEEIRLSLRKEKIKSSLISLLIFLIVVIGITLLIRAHIQD